MIPLSMVAPGEFVQLISIRGGRGIRQRMADLGLTPGSILRVVQTNMRGPFIVAFKGDARLALGRGMAHKIQVMPLNTQR